VAKGSHLLNLIQHYKVNFSYEKESVPWGKHYLFIVAFMDVNGGAFPNIDGEYQNKKYYA
jgi:hypothetical protein